MTHYDHHYEKEAEKERERSKKKDQDIIYLVDKLLYELGSYPAYQRFRDNIVDLKNFCK